MSTTSTLSACYVESTILISSKSRKFSVKVPRTETNQVNYSLNSVAGSQSYCASPGWASRELCWQISNGLVGVLQLIDLSSHDGCPSLPVEIEFDCQIFPGVSCAVDNNALRIYGCVSLDIVWYIDMPISSNGPNFDSLNASSVKILTLQKTTFGAPTAICLSGDILCLGCSSGTVVCCPLGQLSSIPGQGTYELKESGWGIQKLIAGVWRQVQSPSVTACMPLQIHGTLAVAAVYDDCHLRIWNLQRKTQLYSEILWKDHQIADMSLCFATFSQVSSEEAILMAQFESRATMSKECVAIVYSISQAGRLLMKGRIPIQIAPTSQIIAARVPNSKTCWIVTRSQEGSKVIQCQIKDGLCHEAISEDDILSRSVSSSLLHQSLWEECQQRASLTSAADQVLRHIIQPSALCLASLHDTLLAHGAHLGVEVLEQASCDELRAYLAGAVQVLQQQNPTSSESACWLTLLSTFSDTWRRHHPLLSLMTYPGGVVGTIRSGRVLGILRQASPFEGVCYSQPPPDAVQQCARALSKLMGPMCMTSLAAAIISGTAAPGLLFEKLADLCMEGPATPSTSTNAAAHYMSDHERSEFTQWRSTRQRTLYSIASSLGDLRATAVRKALKCFASLEEQPASSQSPPSSRMADGTPPARVSQPGAHATSSAAVPQRSPVSQLTQNYMLCAARQISLAQVESAVAVGLLLSLLKRIASTGALPGDEAAWYALQSDLAPLVTALLQRAALGLWLSTTCTGSPAEADAMGPALSALSHLRLGAHGSTITTVSPNSEALHAKVTCLAAKFLPSFTSAIQLPPDQAFLAHSLGPLLIAYLEYGRTRTSSLSSSSSSSSSLSEHVLDLGYLLFESREWRHLLSLVALSGPAQNDPGPQLLKGLGLVGQCQDLQAQAASSPARSKLLAMLDETVVQAADCFFKAASGLIATSAASEPLWRVVSSLRRQLRLPGAEAAATVLPPDAPYLFFEAVMVLFERERVPQGAARFARAALEQVAVAGGDGEQKQKEGRLWSNVFTYYCEMRDFSSAYTALIANPVPERTLDAVRRLTHHMLEAGALEQLVGLPFSGVVPLTDPSGTGHSKLVPLVDEVLGALVRRAHNSDLSSKPQPYRVLADFAISRCDFRTAARALLVLARRTRLEGHMRREAVQEAIAAYVEALNLLRLLAPSDSWLDMSEPWAAAYAPPSGLERPRLIRLGKQDDESAVASCSGRDLQRRCVTAEEMASELRLLQAALVVSRHVAGQDPLSSWSSVDQVLSTLLLLGQWTEATELASACLRGAALTEALERSLAALATQCVQQSLKQAGTLPEAALRSAYSTSFSLSTSKPAHTEPQHTIPTLTRTLGSSLLGGSAAAAPSWDLLRRLLSHFAGGSQPDDLPSSSQRETVHAQVLPAAVAEAILRADRSIGLPPWLLQWFKEGTRGCMGGSACGPATLMTLYMRHGRLAEAVNLFACQVEQWGRRDPRERQQHAASCWFPHNQVELLEVKLQDEASRVGGGEAAELLGRLDAALRAHEELSLHDTRQMGLKVDVNYRTVQGRPPPLMMLSSEPVSMMA